MAYKILVVDDTETVRAFEHMVLLGAGYEVILANDGVEALDMVERDRPHLVLLDLEMPRMNGIECCKEIKARKGFEHTKVIMVTTRSEYEKISEAFKAGCDDYVTKPIDRQELLTKVEELLRFQRLREILKT